VPCTWCERFGKCGVTEEDDGGEPQIKMYAREDGSFNGEALVVFSKEDSVTLALNLMDASMRIRRAKFGHQ